MSLPSGSLAYREEGAGPCLVLIHGIPGSSRDFRWLTPCLPGLRVVRPDLPGFGDTPVRTGVGDRPEHAARIVLGMMDALELERVVAVGHSFGGSTVAELSRLAPDRVSGCGFVASVGPRAHRGFRKMSRPQWRGLSMALRVPPLRWLLLPKLRDAYRRAGFPRGLADDALLRTVHRGAALSFPEHGVALAEVGVSSLVAWALDDPLVEAGISEAVAAAVPEGPRLSFDSGGHNLQKSMAVELGGALVDYVHAVW